MKGLRNASNGSVLKQGVVVLLTNLIKHNWSRAVLETSSSGVNGFRG
jgi:hypothetical protein